MLTEEQILEAITESRMVPNARGQLVSVGRAVERALLEQIGLLEFAARDQGAYSDTQLKYMRMGWNALRRRVATSLADADGVGEVGRG